VRPSFRKVERAVPVLAHIALRHDPRTENFRFGKIAALDQLEQVALVGLPVMHGFFDGFVLIQFLTPCVILKWNLIQCRSLLALMNE
jgi:hypothetical protein